MECDEPRRGLLTQELARTLEDFRLGPFDVDLDQVWNREATRREQLVERDARNTDAGGESGQFARRVRFAGGKRGKPGCSADRHGNDDHVGQLIQSHVLDALGDVRWPRLTRKDFSGLADSACSKERVKAYVRSNIEYSHPLPQPTADLALLLEFEAAEPASMIARTDAPAESMVWPGKDRYDKAAWKEPE